MLFPRDLPVRSLFWIRAFAAGVYLAANIHAASTASAASLESAPMGIPGKVSGVSIAPGGQSVIGWRFEVSVPFQVESIGGHLFGSNQQPIFGAIVALDSISSLPLGLPFNPSEVVASTTLIPPSPSDEIVLPLSTTLAPGAYALLFGTNELGVTGIAAVPNSPSEQPDIPPTTIQSYIVYGIPRPGRPLQWRENLTSSMRFFVRGTTVGLTADFDIDGDVDAEDLALWETSFGVSVSADANNNSLSDGADFLAWQRQQTDGSPESEASQGVPEPTTGVLSLLAFGWLLGVGSGRHALDREKCSLLDSNQEPTD